MAQIDSSGHPVFTTGTRLDSGRYEIERELGRGGFGTVYLAWQILPFRRQVVIKVPHARLLEDESAGFAERFRSEIGHLAELEHPSIVKIFGAGVESGLPFAVVQFLSGGDLTQLTQREGGRLTPEQVLEFLPGVAAALDFMHRRGVLHRDIKPDNILFDEHGQSYLSDFGISKTLDEPDGEVQTVVGNFIGSAAYVAPEYLERRFGPACDQYSLAVLLYETLSGERPHEADSIRELLMMKMGSPPAPLRDKLPKLPPAIADAVMRGLATDPEERFASCADLADAFAAGVAKGTPGSATATASTPAHREATADLLATTHPQHRGRWIGIAIAALLIAGAAGLWLLQPPAATTPAAGKALLHVEANVGDIRIAVDGKPVASGTGIEVEPNRSVQVRIESDGHEPWDETLRLKPGEERTVHAELVASGPTNQLMIPSGQFFYGCNGSVDRECQDDEKPGGARVLPAFYIDRSEVRVSDYAKCVAAEACTQEGLEMPVLQGAKQSDWAWACNWNKQGRQEHPLNCVTWAEARSYCAWKDSRLPSEEEWEKSARGTDGRKYPWGNDGFGPGSELANIIDAEAKREQPEWDAPAGYRDGFYGTAPVGTFPAGASPYGAVDMIGNVWEWTADWYDASRAERVLRGASWNDAAANARASLRGSLDPKDRYQAAGFRCARGPRG